MLFPVALSLAGVGGGALAVETVRAGFFDAKLSGWEGAFVPWVALGLLVVGVLLLVSVARPAAPSSSSGEVPTPTA